ncbi:MAG: hypothetical protein IKQ96_05075 [Lachnospiraceae bacterium]|nr:hypothetical protein [Lachnospiraceae bacterium]
MNSQENKSKLQLFVDWVNGYNMPEEEYSLGEPVFEEEKAAKEPGASPWNRFHAWVEVNGRASVKKVYPVICVLLCLSFLSLLLVLVAHLPSFGELANPGFNEVQQVYIENVVEDTGAVNAVSGIILNYRGYDTLNEAHVLFVAVAAVTVLLRIDRHKGTSMDVVYEKEESDQRYEPHHDPILRKTTKILVPFILLFGLYIMMNGHLSPGGGFSGGAIAGAGLILFLMAFGFKKIERFFGEKVYQIVRVGALLIYTVLMTYFILMGANQLANGIPLGEPGALFSAGIILPINLVVGLEVACTMYGLFAFFRKGGL